VTQAGRQRELCSASTTALGGAAAETCMGERRGVRRLATGACGGADDDPPWRGDGGLRTGAVGTPAFYTSTAVRRRQTGQ
jgi:hypothetical protein